MRNSNIELLRIVALFGILLWHISMHGFGYANIEEQPVDYVWWNSICASVFAPCVNIFILISGYYGLKLKRNSLIKLESQALFYSFMKMGTIFLLTGEYILSQNIINFTPIIGRVWWFLTDYVLLMLSSPIINEGAKRLSDKQLLYIIIGWLIINGVGMLIRLDINGSNFQSFFLVYLVGIYIRKINDRVELTKCKYLLIGGGNLCSH